MANRINITLGDQMLATLDLMAEKCGMSRSEYIRHMIMVEYGDQLLGVDPITSDQVYERMNQMH